MIKEAQATQLAAGNTARPQVEKYLASSQDNFTALQNAVDTLIERISPICLGQGPEIPCNKKEPAEVLVPLANELCALVQRITTLTDIIRDVTYRVEL